jgi:hypothetical protein
MKTLKEVCERKHASWRYEFEDGPNPGRNSEQGVLVGNLAQTHQSLALQSAEEQMNAS